MMNRLVSVLAIMSVAAPTHYHHIIRTCAAFSIQHHHHAAARTNGRHRHDRRPSLWSLQLASQASSNDSSSHGDGDSSTFCVGILGDLHIDPRKMEDYEAGREQWIGVFQQERQRTDNLALVSLGDLGESKNCDHNEGNPAELYSGTTLCHQVAADYLSSFDVPVGKAGVGMNAAGDGKVVEDTASTVATVTATATVTDAPAPTVNIPYEVIGGNHDLEGIDEFATDEDNLQAFMSIHNKPSPHFARQIADRTFLVGLCSTTFRDAPYTSHEVIIDDDQIRWFEDFLHSHPADDGNKVFVFTHAPPNGSGLRVLQENHVINGCCWLNHSDEDRCRKFIELVREHRCVKGWFSGHFHLGQDYQDSITFPTVPKEEEGPDPNRGSCVFVQTSVMRGGTSRDGRQQSRLLRGSKDGFEICTVDHAKGGEVRLDATITYRDNDHETGVYAHADMSDHQRAGAIDGDGLDGIGVDSGIDIDVDIATDVDIDVHVNGSNEVDVDADAANDDDDDDLAKVKMPEEDDDGYVHGPEEEAEFILTDYPIDEDDDYWWRLRCGRVLGMANGMLLEYDNSTLAPLGLVVSADELVGKKIAIVDSGVPSDECDIDTDTDVGVAIIGSDIDAASMNGANSNCGGGIEHNEQQLLEQAVIMYDEDSGSATVIQPNEDGSYWRKIVRNKIARMQERRREEAALDFLARQFDQDLSEVKDKLQSSWGPYTTTSGMAKSTVVPGSEADDDEQQQQQQSMKAFVSR